MVLDERMEKHLDLLVSRYPSLTVCKDQIRDTYQILKDCYENHGKLLVAGNGGSAADAEHIVGELMKGFKLPRKLDNTYAEALQQADPELGKVLADNLQGALPSIALDGHPALTTAYMFDAKSFLTVTHVPFL